MKAVLEKKQDKINEIKGKIDKSSLMIFCNYRGSTVSDLTNIRKVLRQQKANANVYKNTLASIALKSCNISFPEDMLSNPTITISTEGDPVATSKIIKKIIETSEVISIKGGILDKAYIQESDVVELAQLPSKEELISKILANMNAPISGFVNVITNPIRGLLYVLNSIKEKKQEENK